MSVLDSIKEKAKADVKHILLPEGSEERTVQAARIITDEKIAKVTLLGDEEEIKKVAEKFNVCLCGIEGCRRNRHRSDRRGDHRPQDQREVRCLRQPAV